MCAQNLTFNLAADNETIQMPGWASEHITRDDLMDKIKRAKQFLHVQRRGMQMWIVSIAWAFLLGPGLILNGIYIDKTLSSIVGGSVILLFALFNVFYYPNKFRARFNLGFQTLAAEFTQESGHKLTWTIESEFKYLPSLVDTAVTIRRY